MRVVGIISVGKSTDGTDDPISYVTYSHVRASTHTHTHTRTGRDREWFARNGVSHSLSICNQRPPADFGLQLVRHIDVADLPGTRLDEHFEDMIHFIHQARTAAGVVYVHCAAGVSRSSTAVCAYLIGVHGLSFREAIDFVRTRREVAFPNPGFTEQLQRFERDPRTAELRAKVRASFPHDLALVESDLAEIRAALTQLQARLAAGDRPFDPRDRVLQAMQQMQDRANAEGDEDEKGGNGGREERSVDNNGWGLTWVEEDRTHHSRTDELPR